MTSSTTRYNLRSRRTEGNGESVQEGTHEGEFQSASAQDVDAGEIRSISEETSSLSSVSSGATMPGVFRIEDREGGSATAPAEIILGTKDGETAIRQLSIYIPVSCPRV